MFLERKFSRHDPAVFQAVGLVSSRTDVIVKINTLKVFLPRPPGLYSRIIWLHRIYMRI